MSSGSAPVVPPLDRERFRAVVDGKAVDLHTLRNARGSEVSITNLGAKIEQILVPDRDGVLGDVVLGYDSLDGVIAGHPSMNAFIGRYANRIANARFTLDGTAHALDANGGRHTLHGGALGSRFRVFDVARVSRQSIVLTHLFEDGESGFPGRLPLELSCTLDDDDALTLEWSATAQGRATVASFTGHAFFNLGGDPGVPVTGQLLTLQADEFLPIDGDGLPTGERRGVAGTPMDFRRPKPIGRDIDADDEQLRLARGYDHYFPIRRPAGSPPQALTLAARAEDPASGRVLEVWTTEPGLQLFTGNSLGADPVRDLGKAGRRFAFRGGLCIEPSRFPDAPNRPEFPSSVLRPGEVYAGRIVYRFSTAARHGAG